MSSRQRLFVLLAVAAATCAVPLAAPAANDQTLSHTEVKRDRNQGPKHASLRFLRENRVFIRSQLDRLRTRTTLTSTGQAAIIDERMLRLQELAAAIAAARDTVAVESATAARYELLASVSQLGDLENQLGLMESLVTAQKLRLQILEDDFLGQQETALVVLVRGMPATGEPESISLSEDNEVIQVPLTTDQRAALRGGGVAQIVHRLVEPRDHLYRVAFAGSLWQEAPAVVVPVSAGRDRITFVELDLSRLDRAAPNSGLTAKVWQQ